MTALSLFWHMAAFAAGELLIGGVTLTLCCAFFYWLAGARRGSDGRP